MSAPHLAIEIAGALAAVAVAVLVARLFCPPPPSEE